MLKASSERKPEFTVLSQKTTNTTNVLTVGQNMNMAHVVMTYKLQQKDIPVLNELTILRQGRANCLHSNMAVTLLRFKILVEHHNFRKFQNPNPHNNIILKIHTPSL